MSHSPFRQGRVVNGTTLLITHPGIMHLQLQIHLSAVTSPTLPQRALAMPAPSVLIIRFRMRLFRTTLTPGFGDSTINPTYLTKAPDAMSGRPTVYSQGSLLL